MKAHSSPTGLRNTSVVGKGHVVIGKGLVVTGKGLVVTGKEKCGNLADVGFPVRFTPAKASQYFWH